jgi:hypothetical protein
VGRYRAVTDKKEETTVALMKLCSLHIQKCQKELIFSNQISEYLPINFEQTL